MVYVFTKYCYEHNKPPAISNHSLLRALKPWERDVSIVSSASVEAYDDADGFSVALATGLGLHMLLSQLNRGVPAVRSVLAQVRIGVNQCALISLKFLLHCTCPCVQY